MTLPTEENDGEKNALIEKLAEAGEYINILQKMLIAKQRNVQEEIKLATDAKRNVNEVLFEMTGDVFYREQGGSL